MADYGNEWTNGVEGTGIFEQSDPDENYSRARQPALRKIDTIQ